MDEQAEGKGERLSAWEKKDQPDNERPFTGGTQEERDICGS